MTPDQFTLSKLYRLCQFSRSIFYTVVRNKNPNNDLAKKEIEEKLIIIYEETG